MEDEEALLARHRKEAKELIAKVTALKKSVGKGASDKKKKKEVTEQIAQMEAELTSRHATEMDAFRLQALAPATESGQPSDPPTVAEAENGLASLSLSAPESDPGNIGAKKPNKAQQRKAKKLAQMEEMRREAEQEAAGSVNMKEVESEAISSIIKARNLQLVEIKADGHCLYNALRHQLSSLDGQDQLTYSDIRKLAADHMRAHSDDFLPFLVDDNGDVMSEAKFEKYCDDVERSATWGGQLEIQAVAMALQREIHVIQMGSPPIVIGEDFRSESRAPLILSYHRHYFGLGAHYNSVLPCA